MIESHDTIQELTSQIQELQERVNCMNDSGEFHDIKSQVTTDDFSRKQVVTCSDFLSEAVLWIKEVEMVDSVDELQSSRSIAGQNFPNFELLDARIGSALNKIIQKSHFKEKGQSEGTESSERGSVSSGKTDLLHDLRVLPGCWCP